MLQTALTYLLYSCLISFLFSFFLIELLYRFNIRRREEYDDSINQIKSRKSKIGTPIMGGLLVVITVVYVTVFYNLSRTYTFVPLAAFIITAFLGAADDLLNIFGRKRSSRNLRKHIRLVLNHANPLKRVYLALLIPWTAYKDLFKGMGSKVGSGLYPHEKLIVQVIAGGIVAYWVYFKLHWSILWLPFAHSIDIHWLIVPFIILLVVGTANAVNITDGMDGLSAGTLITAFIAYLVISLELGLTGISNLIATTLGALITYLYFNIKPARFEMGDVGSLSLGTLLATIAILMHREILLLIIGGIFVIETGSVIIQLFSKKFLNKKVFEMAPLHHHLEFKGWSEEKVIMRLWLFSILFGFIGIWISTF